MKGLKTAWSNCSVLKFACGKDPIQATLDQVRKVVFEALEKGYAGPPFNPFDLAEQMGLTILPSQEVNDARVVSRKDGGYQVEFNPNRNVARRNFSIAHEIVHTLFPDCGDRVRNRETTRSFDSDDWELELLCNVGAAEILMPIGSFPSLKDESLTIENILRLRLSYAVSTEAVMLRAVRLSEAPCMMFAASQHGEARRYKIDYCSPSPSFQHTISRNFSLPLNSGVASCRAIGYTFSGRETWANEFGSFDIECVGIPPYPGQSTPRVVGVVKSLPQRTNDQIKINYSTGDATSPLANGKAIIAHVVNDKAKRWGGGGFAYKISKVWPQVYEDFIAWTSTDLSNFSLGKSRKRMINDDICVFTMIAQHGYGSSPTPRIRYQALASGLDSLYLAAKELEASVHMPRIGCGHAGGDWRIVGEMIEDKLTRRGIPVTVYDLPQ